MKKISLLVITIFIVNVSLAQNRIPPDYLLEQDFPDSVRNLKILKLDGEKLDFSDMLKLHTGKKIIIDFWASWCKDCIVGLPKLDKLKQQTGEDKIVYVFISLDKEDVRWRSAINRFNIRGEHYRIETGWHNTLSNYIDLDWIPRYLVLNEAGRIIIPKAISADDGVLQRSLME